MTEIPAPPQETEAADPVASGHDGGADDARPAWAIRRFRWRSAASIAIVGVVLAIPMRALLRYREAGIDNFLITGFDWLADTHRIGTEIGPELRRRGNA